MLFPSPLTAVHRGVLFEKQALHVLQTCLSMELHRVGGKGDGGVDLRGWWWLPPLKCFASRSTAAIPVNGDESHSRPNRIRVISQCKAEKKKLGPGYVREMEGVLHRHLHESVTDFSDIAPSSPSRIDIPPTIALIVSSSPFTKAAALRAFSSTLPFLLIHLPFVEPINCGRTDHDVEPKKDLQQLGSALWNPALANGILEGELELRWERITEKVDQDANASENYSRPGLWWKNQPVQSWVPNLERS